MIRRTNSKILLTIMITTMLTATMPFKPNFYVSAAPINSPASKATLKIISIANITDRVMQNDSNYTLPKQATAIMSDGSTTSVDVKWKPSIADTSKVGIYIYSGAVSGYSDKVSLILTVYNIKSIADINAIVNQNDSSYALPSTVTATMNDGTTQDVAVTWDKPLDTSKAGTFTYTGTVSGYGSNVNLKLVVNSFISSIADINATVNQNDSSYALPSTVTATMSDGTTQDVAVTWDKPLDTSKAGTFTYTGTVSGYSGNVKLILMVNAYISSITDINATVNQNDSNYALPGTVTATMSDGTTQNLAVTWDRPLDTSKVGTITYIGTVNGYSGNVKLILMVNAYISSIADINATVNQNDNTYALPNTVAATMSDGTIQDVSVTWDNPLDTSKAGTFTFTGTVNGYGGKVNLILGVNVCISSIADISAAVYKYESYTLPSTVKTTMSDGTTQDKTVTWNPSSVDTSKTGTFYYTGTVSGYTGTITLTLTVEIDRVISFPDENLENKIRARINKPTGDILLTDVIGITYLDCDNDSAPGYGAPISDLCGLENLTNLIHLDLRYNQVSNLNPISRLTNLQELDLLVNQISDISALSGLTNLQVLDLESNQISDISALSGLTKLRDIRLSYNQISDISVLSGLTNLQVMMLYFNKISDISSLSKLTNLTGLLLDFNQISDIGALSGLTNLDTLWVTNNQIRDIGALSGLTKLRDVRLSYNQIRDIGALSGLTELRDVGLSYNQISSISANSLLGLPNLKYLDLVNNQISDISGLSELTNLSNLYLENNQISDIGALSGLTNLCVLYLNNNQISDIGALSGLTNLYVLYLNNNQISDIGALSGLTNLFKLYLNNNQISDISALSGLTNLFELNLNNNQISDISALSGLTNLYYTLDLSNNQISIISALFNLTNLKELYLYNNPVPPMSVQQLRTSLTSCLIEFY